MSTASPTRRRICAGVVAASMAAGAAITLGATAATAAEIPDTFLSTASTTWSYSDDNSDPAAGSDDRLVWTEAGYDDAAWKTATGAFGVKNGAATGIGSGFPINTLLNQYIAGTSDDVPTFHLRTSIDIDAEQLAAIDGLSATVSYDDALQVFVNGEKVAGFIDEAVEAAPEAERNLMYAGSSNGDPVTSTFTIDADDLVAGENTIAVALYQDRITSSDIYFDFKSLTPVVPGEEGEAAYSDIVLTIGTDESTRNVTWYTDTDSAQVLQYAVATDSGDFPTTGVTSLDATGAVTTSGENNRRAALTGLTENTDYVYRVGSETDGWSAVRSFSTASFSGDYDFLFFGDPQIGASGNAERDGAGWADTLNIATETYPNSELLFSAGDQVESAGNETHYEQFLAPSQLSEIPLVPVNGNHDVGSKAYEQHYTVPNLDPTAGAGSGTSSGGDYWFLYKDVLYVVLNTNSNDDQSHIDFMEKVVAEHGADAKWKVLAFHHSIYSVASHVFDSQIERLRTALPTAISDQGFDLVLQGHDHSYTRSYLIKDGELADATEVAGQSEVTPGEGEVLYVTANSASGSKYYDVRAPDAWYASVINQEKVRNYSHIEVTGDSLTVTTLRSQANGTNSPVNSVVDEVTLVRDDVTAPEITLPTENKVEQGADFDALAGVTATDERDGDLTSSITVEGTVDTDTLGDYELVYAVADAAGNEVTAARTVTVVEAGGVTPPAGEAKITVEGDAVLGGKITFAGTGFTPGASVNATVHSDPVDLGTFVAGADGTLSFGWTIPTDFAVGAHTIVITLADGSTITAAFTITAGAGGADGDLATTGAELPIAVLALAMALLIGGGVLIARRRMVANRD